MKIRNKKGFTIVELVIVIGVIGILSAILIPTFVSLTANAQKAREQSDVSNIYSMYAAEAADNVVDGTNPEIAIELAGQDQVLIIKYADSTTYYKHDGKSWVSSTSEPAAPTDTTWKFVAGAAHDDEENSKFNKISASEYYVVKYAAPNA